MVWVIQLLKTVIHWIWILWNVAFFTFQKVYDKSFFLCSMRQMAWNREWSRCIPFRCLGCFETQDLVGWGFLLTLCETSQHAALVLQILRISVNKDYFILAITPGQQAMSHVDSKLKHQMWPERILTCYKAKSKIWYYGQLNTDPLVPLGPMRKLDFD